MIQLLEIVKVKMGVTFAQTVEYCLQWHASTRDAGQKQKGLRQTLGLLEDPDSMEKGYHELLKGYYEEVYLR